MLNSVSVLRYDCFSNTNMLKFLVYRNLPYSNIINIPSLQYEDCLFNEQNMAEIPSEQRRSYRTPVRNRKQYFSPFLPNLQARENSNTNKFLVPTEGSFAILVESVLENYEYIEDMN